LPNGHWPHKIEGIDNPISLQVPHVGRIGKAVQISRGPATVTPVKKSRRSQETCLKKKWIFSLVKPLFED